MAAFARTGTYDVDDGTGVNAGNVDGDSSPVDGNAAPDNSGDGNDIVRPERLGNDDGNSGEPVGRKRRADAGRKRGPRSKTDAADLGSLAEIISETHSMLAYMTGIQEMALDETKEEHVKLARAVNRVAAHYDLPAIDPKTRDWLLLAKTAGIIYGSRFMAYQARRGSAKSAAPAKPASAQTEVLKQAPPQQNAKTSGVYREVTIPGFGSQRILVN